MNPNETFFNDFQAETTDYRKHRRDFIKEMIALVHKRKPLWERDSHDRELKVHLWQETANILGVNVDVCQQRWKGLREKYIRQKRRYLDSGEKWHYLDDLSFLDTAISYRKKYLQPPENYSNDSQFEQFSSDCEVINEHNVELYPESEASSGMLKIEEQPVIYANHDADSTLNENHRAPDVLSFKKREVCSGDEEHASSKKRKCDHTRTPEEIFGEFVAASLASKSGPERSMAMVEIMTILARTN